MSDTGIYEIIEQDDFSKGMLAERYLATSIGETTREQLVKRLTSTLLSKHHKDLIPETTKLLLGGYITPAGRILANTGLPGKTTMVNCFVNEEVGDNMEDIMKGIAHTAITMSRGGGVGTPFGTIRPYKAEVKGKSTYSSGVLAYMDAWDQVSKTIRSAGERRGAMMATLPDDHPDVYNPEHREIYTRENLGLSPDQYDPRLGKLKNPSFISAKLEPGRLTQFNVSVLISDRFMTQVQKDGRWDLGFWVKPYDDSHVEVIKKKVVSQQVADDLGVNVGDMHDWYVYRRVKAKKMFEDITSCTYLASEPGVIFIDKVNANSPLSFYENITCCNPCGEQMLPDHGACNLGSVVLASMVKNPFTDAAEFDFDTLRLSVKRLHTLLDSALDHTRFPLDEQRIESDNKRRVGLGFTGLGTMLVMMKIKYGSPEALQLTEEIMKTICLESYQNSINLAKKLGPCELMKEQDFREKYVNTKFIKETLPKSMRDDILKTGIRNCLNTTVAPNGTISTVLNNVSSGIEPVFAFVYERTVNRPGGETSTDLVSDFSVRLYEKLFPEELKYDEHGQIINLPDYFIATKDLTIEQHLHTQDVVQRWTDNSVSKTINVPKETQIEPFMEIYFLAWKLRVLSCTTYRPSALRGSVLVDIKDKESLKKAMSSNKRNEILEGITFSFRWKGDLNFYCTLNHNDLGKISEIFINSSREDSPYLKSWAKMISFILKETPDQATSKILKLNEKIMDATGGCRLDGKYFNTVMHYISQRIFDRQIQLDEEYAEEDSIRVLSTGGEAMPLHCEVCASSNITSEGGCFVCKNCGYSHCQ